MNKICKYKTQAGFCTNDVVMNKSIKHTGTPSMKCVENTNDMYSIVCGYRDE